MGHCLLVFRGLKKIDFDITIYSKQDGKAVWGDPITFSYSGTPNGEITEFTVNRKGDRFVF